MCYSKGLLHLPLLTMQGDQITILEPQRIPIREAYIQYQRQLRAGQPRWVFVQRGKRCTRGTHGTWLSRCREGVAGPVSLGRFGHRRVPQTV